MLCILNGIDENTFDAGLDTTLVALAFEEPVALVLIVKQDTEITPYHDKLSMLKQSGLEKIYTISSPHHSFESSIPIETQSISALELRELALKHNTVLNF